MSRMWAIVEREMRRFRRSPVLIAMSMVFPLAQLVILGYAFGGNVKHLKLAVVDQDRGVPAVRIRELVDAVADGAHTVDVVDYTDEGRAVADLLAGKRPRTRTLDVSLVVGVGQSSSNGHAGPETHEISHRARVDHPSFANTAHALAWLDSLGTDVVRVKGITTMPGGNFLVERVGRHCSVVPTDIGVTDGIVIITA